MNRPIFADLWLFAGFVVDFWPMKREKKMSRMMMGVSE